MLKITNVPIEQIEIPVELCPCCGGRAKVESVRSVKWFDISISTYEVECVRCGMRTPLKSTIDEAVTVWNSRVGK